MITSVQALILGLLQGAFELFPVSSLGHSVIFPALFGWDIKENNNAFLIFLVATHIATALVLIGFYWKTWVGIAQGVLTSLRDRRLEPHDTEAKLGWLLIIGTVPAGLLGLLFEHPIRDRFVSASSAAFFLIINGLMLIAVELMRTRRDRAGSAVVRPDHIAKLGWWDAVKTGTVQALALIPGFSRSGASMAGGLLSGLNNEDAAHFSFLLATPIILAAGLKKLPELFKPEYHALVTPSLIGAVCAALSAYMAVKFLTRYFKTNSLWGFGIYCVLGGVVYSAILAFK